MRRPKPSAKPRSKPAPRPERKDAISAVDHYWVRIYGELMRRYTEAPGDWNVAMTAVRLYTKRVGLDVVLQSLQRHGVAAVAERCRHEMTLREEFFARMCAEHPPDDPADVEKAIIEMAEDLAVLDSPDGGMRLLRYLDRLLQREKALNLGTAKPARPAGSPLPRAGS